MAAYRELLRIARRTLGYLHVPLTTAEEGEVPALRDWRAKALQYSELLGRVVDQTKRRVGISYLKRCFGLRRCRWRGLDRFRAYVWSAIVAHNLAVLARSPLKLKPT